MGVSLPGGERRERKKKRRRGKARFFFHHLSPLFHFVNFPLVRVLRHRLVLPPPRFARYALFGLCLLSDGEDFAISLRNRGDQRSARDARALCEAGFIGRRGGVKKKEEAAALAASCCFLFFHLSFFYSIRHLALCFSSLRFLCDVPILIIHRLKRKHWNESRGA